MPSCGPAVPGVLSGLCDFLPDEGQLGWASPCWGLVAATPHSGCSLCSSSALIFATGAAVSLSLLSSFLLLFHQHVLHLPVS